MVPVPHWPRRVAPVWRWFCSNSRCFNSLSGLAGGAPHPQERAQNVRTFQWNPHRQLRFQKICLGGILFFGAGHVIWLLEGPPSKGGALPVSVILAVLPPFPKAPPLLAGALLAQITWPAPKKREPLDPLQTDFLRSLLSMGIRSQRFRSLCGFWCESPFKLRGHHL